MAGEDLTFPNDPVLFPAIMPKKARFFEASSLSSSWDGAERATLTTLTLPNLTKTVRLNALLSLSAAGR